ncbi:MAG: DNA polymerase IV [Paracoccaceae bacterium]
MSKEEIFICRDCAKLSLDENKCQKCNSPKILKHDELLSLNIAHIDCDAFYASVEKSQNPQLINKAIIVGGGKRGVVTTCCYIARIKGVKSAMPIFKAKRLCPEAIFIKPRMSLYKHISNLVFSKLKQLTPLVETIAFDEAYLDFSGTYQLYKKTPAELLVKLALEIENELGITISIGLSENKFLAKLASSINKPKGFTVIGKSEKLEFLKNLHIKNIPGIGPSLQRKFKKKSIMKIDDLNKFDQKKLVKNFGSFGKTIWNMARGIDERKINPLNSRKSISKETTFDTNISDFNRLKKTLWLLSEEISEILKKNNLFAGSITIKLKRHNFKIITSSFTFLEPTFLAEYIYQEAISLLSNKFEMAPFRLIGLSAKKFSLKKQISFSNSKLEPKFQKIEKTEYVIDKIRQKFGKQIIKKGRSFN